MVLKTKNKYPIIRQQRFTASSTSLSSKMFEASFFTEPKITNWKDETINRSNSYLIISFTLVPEKHFAKLFNTSKFDFPFSIEMRYL